MTRDVYKTKCKKRLITEKLLLFNFSLINFYYNYLNVQIPYKFIIIILMFKFLINEIDIV
jgi:hypothetical protein